MSQFSVAFGDTPRHQGLVTHSFFHKVWSAHDVFHTKPGKTVHYLCKDSDEALVKIAAEAEQYGYVLLGSYVCNGDQMAVIIARESDLPRSLDLQLEPDDDDFYVYLGRVAVYMPTIKRLYHRLGARYLRKSVFNG